MSDAGKNAVAVLQEAAFHEWATTKHIPPICLDDDRCWSLIAEAFAAGHAAGRKSVIGEIDDTEPH